MIIKAGEGGLDAKDLVGIQAEIYLKYAERNGIKTNVTESVGWLTIEFSGDGNVVRRLLNESGGHRWQRIPPTERKGRVHTSSVTIAAFEPTKGSLEVDDSDIDVRTTKDSGPGGQHRNKTESAVVMTHRPTGITVKVAKKSQHRNKAEARELIEEKVLNHYRTQQAAAQSKDIKDKHGSGMRGDKIRTYRMQDDVVIDHVTNKKTSLKKVMQGKI